MRNVKLSCAFFVAVPLLWACSSSSAEGAPSAGGSAGAPTTGGAGDGGTTGAETGGTGNSGAAPNTQVPAGTVLFDTLKNPRSIAVDDQAIYFGTSGSAPLDEPGGDAGLWKAPKDGSSAPQALVSSTRVLEVVTAGDNVFYAGVGDVSYVAKSGGEAHLLARAPGAELKTYENTVYFVETFSGCLSTSSKIQSVQVDGTGLTEAASISGCVIAFDVDAQYFYLALQGDPETKTDKIVRRAKSGGAEELLVDGISVILNGITLADGFVYYLDAKDPTRAATSYALKRVPLAGGDAQTLVEKTLPNALNSFGHLVLVGDMWAGTFVGTARGSEYRLLLSAPGMVNAVAADATHVYWVAAQGFDKGWLGRDARP